MISAWPKRSCWCKATGEAMIRFERWHASLWWISIFRRKDRFQSVAGPSKLKLASLHALDDMFRASLREGFSAQCHKRKRHRPLRPCLPLRKTRGTYIHQLLGLACVGCHPQGVAMFAVLHFSPSPSDSDWTCPWCQGGSTSNAKIIV